MPRTSVPTPAEARTLWLAAHGLRNCEIAAVLERDPSTISHHLAHYYDRVGVKRPDRSTRRAPEVQI